MPETITQYLAELTLAEKAALTVGATPWQTLTVERLGLKHITVSDGPHGVRRAADPSQLASESHPATCFPVAAALASSWDVALMHELGQALADEAIALDVDILLGPGINMKRSPLCGRNFEYFSEDPLLAGELSASLIQGIQSKGVGTSLKHFAVNNQETRRFTINAIVDERTLHELYLPAFEIAVKKGKPWTLMCAYNRVNGDYCSEHRYLLTDVLRGQWGFEGFVMSDWGAVHRRVPALQAGLELQMPGSAAHSVQAIIDAVNSGALDEAVLNQAVERLLTIFLRAQATPKGHTQVDVDGHHALARRIAAECIVLLKNEGDLLPLTGHETLAVIGTAAQTPVYQGGGSSHVRSTRVDNALTLLKDRAEVQYAVGDVVTGVGAGGGGETQIDQTRIDEAVAIARGADVALLMIALPASIESEGYDRQDLRLTPQQEALILAVAKANSRTVVVLNNGSALDMQAWIGQVPAVLEAWLPGQAGAGAILDVLYGAVNPSGKLAETFPLKLSDTPTYLNFPGDKESVRYGEGLFIGYRAYDTLERAVLFPFGHGLSYTQFAYRKLQVTPDHFALGQTITVTLDVTNTGKRDGQEVVQVYVRDLKSRLQRPVKELKAFAKIALKAGETQRISLTLDDRAFSYYDPLHHQWVAEAGEFEIMVGSSSAAIHLSHRVTLTEGTPLPVRLTLDSTFGDWLADPRSAALVQPILQMMGGGAMDSAIDRSAPQNSDGSALGTDMSVFIRDLPLTVMLAFAGDMGIAPAEIVKGMLAQLEQAT